MKKFYYKVGKRYEPFGICEAKTPLQDGIWLVQSKEYSRSLSNLGWLSHLYGVTKVGDIPTADFTEIAKMEQYVDAVSKVLQAHDIPPMGICLADLAREIIKEMHEVNKSARVHG